MTKISVLRIVESTTVDGPGMRTSIYCAGCTNFCQGCHNPQSWDINNGTLMEIDDILAKIKDEDFCDVTFSGGDPMLQASAFTQLAQRIKTETSKNIWCYTGYTVDQILCDPTKRALMETVDVLVDGRFVEALKDPNLLFRGSKNQRLVDVRRTLQEGHVVELDLESKIKFE